MTMAVYKSHKSKVYIAPKWPAMQLKKVLVIRFSSIGDIVLTTPVLRAIKTQHPDCQVHFLTKKSFAFLLEANPNVDKVLSWEEHKDKLNSLKSEAYDCIVDLHKNLRSGKVKRSLGGPFFTFNKLNIDKWMYVNLKRDRMPDLHLVDRYFLGLQALNLKADGGGLEYHYTAPVDLAPGLQSGGYVALVLGAAHMTKQIPNEINEQIIEGLSGENLVLLGGPAEKTKGEDLSERYPHVKNYCGSLSLDESAKVIEEAKAVVNADTGLMHIAAAFKKRQAVLWGNTTPKLGMYPYGYQEFMNFEVENLSCRPCSKIGKKKCPKGHFKCMMQQDVAAICDYILAS